VTRFAGAVLTGGKSTRMGQDKVGLFADRVEAALREAGAATVFRVGGPTGIDDGAGVGPLAGIRAALAYAREPMVVILACDLPDVSPVGIRVVVAALDAHPTELAAVPVVDGKTEPLHAVWRTAALARIPDDENAVHRALAAVDAIEVHGLESTWVRNVNTPEDL
jgi:molybdopterin-guanine dinucleotide biosynthesis protein A